jgi:hypothetical protein
MKPDAVSIQNQPQPTPKALVPAAAPKEVEPQPSVARDAANFSYVKANQPKGVEVPLRMVQNVVSNADDIGRSAVTEAAHASSWLNQSWIARVVSWLPQKMGNALNVAAKSKAIGLLEKVTQLPFYGAFAGFVTKASPVVGLVMAPFDIKNMINVWKDPKALLPHKVLTSVRTVTGTLMCLGGLLSFALPALGFPAAGSFALSWALKIGLVNLVASIPYWAKGIGGAVAGAAHAIGGVLRKAFSAL